MACLSREFCLVLLSLEIMLCTMRGRPADRRVMEAPDPAVRTLSRTSLSREPESSRTPLSSSSRREHEVRESGYYNRVRSSGVFIGVCEAVHSFFGCIRYWLPICSNEVSAKGPPPQPAVHTFQFSEQQRGIYGSGKDTWKNVSRFLSVVLKI